MPPKLLIFDLGGVIVGHDNDLLWSRLAGLTPHANAAPTAVTIAGAVRGSGIGDGRVSVQELHRSLVDQFQMDDDWERFAAAWSSHFSPMPAMERVIARLASAEEAAHRLRLLSNTNAEHWQYLRGHYPLLSHFELILLSHDLGLLKPDMAIYREAARLAGVELQQCFFTDDRQDNVDGANAVGMDALRFESAEQIRAELARRGVTIDD